MSDREWTGRLRWRGFFRRRLQMERKLDGHTGRLLGQSTMWFDVNEVELSEIHETVASLRKQLGMARIREERQQTPVTTLECRVRPRADMPLSEIESRIVEEIQLGPFAYTTGGMLAAKTTHRLGEETSEQTRPCQAPPHRNPPDVDSGSLASCVSRHTSQPSDSFQGFPSSSDTSSSTTAD
jgi:hypothetical protein